MRAVLLAILLAVPATYAAVADEQAAGARLSDTYPHLCAGCLRFARVEDLKEGVIASADGLIISQKDIDEETSASPASLREQVRKYPMYALEQMITRKLILREAQNWAGQVGKDSKTPEQALVREYLASQIPKIDVSSQEVEELYAEQAEKFGGASLETMRATIADYCREEKRTGAELSFMDLVGKRRGILVSAAWVKKQAEAWAKNPVEQARASGKPSFVNFGVIGCCDIMHPVIEAIRPVYGDRLNVVFVHVGEEKILASLYGIRSIPVQVFMDKAGKEQSGHTGALSKEEVKAKLAELGVK